MLSALRRLGPDDHAAADNLSRVAFGLGRPAPDEPLPDRNGQLDWGIFAGSALAAKATDRRQEQWFGGCLVPTSGLAGVVVAPEHRGRGLAQQVVTEALQTARERGAVISTLFRTAPALYRRLGYEQVGALLIATLPSAALTGIRMPADIRLRAAAPADIPALLGVYAAIARQSNGMLDHSGPLFPNRPEDLLDPFDGVTLAEAPDGTVEGYVSWVREPGGESSAARLTASDVLALSGRATTALLATLGSWASVVGTLALRVTDPDPLMLALPVGTLRMEKWQPWMLRILDAPGAVAARGWPPHLSGSVDLEIGPSTPPDVAGRYRLVLDAGVGALEAGGSGTAQLGANAFAALYAGGAGTAVLRRTGGLSGGTPATDAWLDAAFAGPRPAILDDF